MIDSRDDESGGESQAVLAVLDLIELFTIHGRGYI
jgi:hypothetical protein